MAFFLKKNTLFDSSRQEEIMNAIKQAEMQTSGEIRLFIEAKNPWIDPLDRAGEIFFRLRMNETRHRNAVLIYVAHKHRELAIFGDEGIHQRLGSDYWRKEVELMLGHFKTGHLADGIIQCIRHIGGALQEKFPFVAGEDKNELPDDVIFG